jgi:glutamate-5-semialdehyde dehydrogenase
MTIAESIAKEAALTPDEIVDAMQGLGKRARAASAELALASAEIKNTALRAAAAEIRTRSADIAASNDRDMAAAEERDLTSALLDRLKLDAGRIEGMAKGLEEVAELADPVGDIIAEWTRPNGLKISRVRVPLGVIGIIYESRPNVTADAGGLCLKSGNAVILRGGSESFHSSRVIAECLQAGLAKAGLSEGCIQLVPTRDRAAVGVMLTMVEDIDVIIPRGGRSLIERVSRESRIPVIKHLDGICHIYVHGGADATLAREVTLNAKMRRPGICGAVETLLIDRAIVASHLPGILDDLIAAGCEVRGEAEIRAVDSRVHPASDIDWDTEYLDAIISVKAVADIGEAIAHINGHGSHHTDSILTEDTAAAERFLLEVDSGIVMHNTSTQFADGGEFGMGAEIGISTGKLHARGPVGAEQLTSYKYVVQGTGQVRP